MKPAKMGIWACGLVVLIVGAKAAQGQFVVDRQARSRPVPIAQTYEVRAVGIDARVRDGVAEVRVQQTFHNPGSTPIEAQYLFPLPEGAAVADLVLMVDGQELAGRVLPKAEARRIYEEIVRTKRDPALLEYMGGGLYQASVFPIPAGADRVVTLRYTQVCHRDRDVVEFAFPLAHQKQAGKPIGKLDMVVRIDSKTPIKSIYSPGHDLKITRSGEQSATATLDQRDVVPTTDLRLVYTLGEGAFGASLVSYRPSEGDDGYFILLASPRVEAVESKPMPKTVIFVIDRSGSMAGKKIDQARGALQFVLDNLRDEDTFDIVAYDDRIETFKPELQRYSTETRAEATRFVANIRPGGGTNIDGGLQAALGLIPDDTRPSYLIFLTDGLATNGETAELKIAANSRAANKGKARIFAFGVGFDVNARLLDRLSGGSGGTSEYVRPDEDIEAHVSTFYSKMTRPALSAISIALAGHDVNRTYPRDIPDLFEGGQLLWVGRYPKEGPTTIQISGKVGGQPQSFEFPAELAGAGKSSGHDYVEKLWAVRRAGFIIDQIDLNGANQELTDELVDLGTHYGLLTPYTSFLADERVQLHAQGRNGQAAAQNLTSLATTQGQFGTAQRSIKQSLNQAKSLQDVDKTIFLSESAGLAPARPAPQAGMMGRESELADSGGGIGGGGFAGGGAGVGGAGMMGNDRNSTTQPRMMSMSGGMGGMGGGMAGMGGGMGAPQSTRPFTDVVVRRRLRSGEPNANIRRVGTKTFFHKDGRWVDAAIKPEDEAKAIVIEQFGDKFFQLAANQTAEQNQYLAFDEPVTVRIADQVYRIEPAKPTQ